MAVIEWGYLVVLWGTDASGNDQKIGMFEALGLSPTTVFPGDSNRSDGNPDPYTIGNGIISDRYNNNPDPYKIAGFISLIGEADTVSVKKLRDSATDDIRKFYDEKKKFSAINIFVFRKSAIPEDLTGKPYLSAMMNNIVTSAYLQNALPSKWLMQYSIEPNRVGTGWHSAQYDYFTFVGDHTELNSYLKHK
jgi:hypothetical protein